MPSVRKTKKKMSPNNYLPKENKNKLTTEDIIIKDDNLDYWRKESEYIDATYRWHHEKTNDTELILKHSDYPFFDTDDWVFLRYYLNKRKIHYTNTKKGKIMYNMKDYTKEQAKFVIEYILHGDESLNTPRRVINYENNTSSVGSRELTEEEIDALEEAAAEAKELREQQLLKEKANAASLKRKTKKEKKYFNFFTNKSTRPYRKGLTRRKKQVAYTVENMKRLKKRTKNLLDKLREE